MSSARVVLAPTDSVVVLTGAGVSAESGLRTFRDGGGLWHDHRVEAVASPEGFAGDPALVWRFYGERRAEAAAARPNPGHHALAALAAALGPARFLLATQNVDGLHEAAGSRDVAHIHGELFVTRCSDPDCPAAPFRDERCDFPPPLPRCPCGALLRPHVVWFGESPLGFQPVKRRVQSCSLLVVVGSSGTVFPAAGLVREITLRRQWGERVRSLYVGLEAPANAADFDALCLGPSGETLPGLFEVRR